MLPPCEDGQATLEWVLVVTFVIAFGAVLVADAAPALGSALNGILDSIGA
jgi:hypothetical protein